MNETLKAAGNLGAELGAARAEIEKLRKALQGMVDFYGYAEQGPIEAARAALSQQAEQQPACWASSTALAKLQNGRNNSPCVLTDGPAELNDTPLYAAPQPEQSVPEGFALVPVKPTVEMIAALGFEGDEVAAIGHASIFSEMTECYGAMLAVAPSPAMDAQQ